MKQDPLVLRGQPELLAKVVTLAQQDPRDLVPQVLPDPRVRKDLQALQTGQQVLQDLKDPPDPAMDPLVPQAHPEKQEKLDPQAQQAQQARPVQMVTQDPQV